MPSYKFAPKSVNFSLKNQIANILSLQGIYIQSVTTTRLYCYCCSPKQHMNTWTWLCSNESTGNEPTRHSLPTNDLSDQIWKQSHTSNSLVILLISVEFPLLVLTLAVIYGHLLSFVGLARIYHVIDLSPEVLLISLISLRFFFSCLSIFNFITFCSYFSHFLLCILIFNMLFFFQFLMVET